MASNRCTHVSLAHQRMASPRGKRFVVRPDINAECNHLKHVCSACFCLSEAHDMLRRDSPNASAAQAAHRRLLNNSRQSTLRLLAGAQYHAILLGLPVTKLNGSFTRTMALPGRRMLPTGSNKKRVDSIKQPPEKPVRRLSSCIIISRSHPATHPPCLRPPSLPPAPPPRPAPSPLTRKRLR